MRPIDADALRAEWLEAVGEYTANEILGSIDDMPTIPQEISAREYTVAREKMCDSFYSCDKGCPIWDFMRKRGESSCPDFEASHPFDFIAIVEEWAREHPEERSE